jgi:hypothetical protein
MKKAPTVNTVGAFFDVPSTALAIHQGERTSASRGNE